MVVRGWVAAGSWLGRGSVVTVAVAAAVGGAATDGTGISRQSARAVPIRACSAPSRGICRPDLSRWSDWATNSPFAGAEPGGSEPGPGLSRDGPFRAGPVQSRGRGVQRRARPGGPVAVGLLFLAAPFGHRGRPDQLLPRRLQAAPGRLLAVANERRERVRDRERADDARQTPGQHRGDGGRGARDDA